MEKVSNLLQSISVDNIFTILLVICAVLVVILVITIILSVKNNHKEKQSKQNFEADSLEPSEQIPEEDDEPTEEEPEQDSQNPDEYEEEFEETSEEDDFEEDEVVEEPSGQEPDRFVLEESEQVHAKRSDLIPEQRLVEPVVAKDLVEEETDEIPIEDNSIEENIVKEDVIQPEYIPELMPAQDMSENLTVQNEYVARHANKNQKYFDAVTDRLDAISEGQNAIKETVENFNGRFDANKDAFDELRREFDALKKDVDTRLCSIGEQVHRRIHDSDNYQSLSEQIHNLSDITIKTQNVKNENVEQIIQAQTEKLNEDIQNLRKELNTIPTQMERLSSPSEETMNQMAKLEAKVDLLGSQILMIANSVSNLHMDMDNKINNLSMNVVKPEIKGESVQSQAIKHEQNFEADSKATSEVKSEVAKIDSQEVSKSETSHVAKPESKPVEKVSKEVETNKSSSEKVVKKDDKKEVKQQSAKSQPTPAKSKNSRSHRKATKQKQTLSKQPVKQAKPRSEFSPEDRQAHRLETEANLQSRYDEEIKESKMMVKNVESSQAVALTERPEKLKSKSEAMQAQDNVKAFQEKMRKRKEQREQIEREKAAQAKTEEIETVSAKVIPSDGSNQYVSDNYKVPVEKEQSEIEKADAIVNAQPQQEVNVSDDYSQTRPTYERMTGEQAHQRRVARPTRASYVSNRATRG